MSVEKFELDVVKQQFEKCLEGSEDDILLEGYLSGFQELCKFFSLMGSVFGFVSSDVSSKLIILEEYRNKPDTGEKFKSVKTMMEYETNSELLHKKDYVSGSRTLLRLHRGLDFLRDFLKRLSLLQADDKTHSECHASYADTLAQYHPWIIRKAANVAIYALPNRDKLLNTVCADASKAIENLPAMLEVADLVYERINSLFTKYELHELP